MVGTLAREIDRYNKREIERTNRRWVFREEGEAEMCNCEGHLNLKAAALTDNGLKLRST